MKIYRGGGKKPPPANEGDTMGKRFRKLLQIGDAVEKALSAVGITPEKVEAYLGKPCRCRERKEKLNQIGNWAYRILSGETTNAKEELDKIVGDSKPE